MTGLIEVKPANIRIRDYDHADWLVKTIDETFFLFDDEMEYYRFHEEKGSKKVWFDGFQITFSFVGYIKRISKEKPFIQLESPNQYPELTPEERAKSNKVKEEIRKKFKGKIF